MAKKFRNIWLIFFIILGFMVFLYLYASYAVWKETFNRYTLINENRTRLIAKSTEGFLYQIEIIEEILEQSLLNEEHPWTAAEQQDLFQRIIDLNEAIYAVALISPTGDFIATNLGLPVEMLPNVLDNEFSRDTFLEALESGAMSLGRTYPLPLTGRFAFPVRKTLYSADGKPAFVLSLAVDAVDTVFIDDDILASRLDSIHILREKDRYPQIFISDNQDLDLGDIYGNPIPDDVYRDSISRMQKSSGCTLDEILGDEITVSFHTASAIDRRFYLISSRFLSRYRLWVNSYMRYDRIVSEIIRHSLWYLTVFLGTVIVLYLLFRYIIRIEKRKNEDLEHRAYHDDLTGLYNRNYLYRIYEEWKHENRLHAMLLVDIDNFRYVNDSFGHRTGDLIIKAIAACLENTVGDGGKVFRLDGDEFVILTGSVDSLDRYCIRIQNALRSLDPLTHSKVSVGASIGVCLYPKDAIHIEELLINANIALMEAKKPKNCFEFFCESMRAEFLRYIELEKEIDEALLRNEFTIVYQPQMKIDKKMQGVEALVRWNSERFGFIPPDVFIPLAESSGKMINLGEYIIDKALSEIEAIQQRTGKRFQLALNISVMQFMEKDFVESLIARVDESGMEPESITLEVTESVFINDLDYVIRQLERLGESGFTISMDDFGTGYSSLSMLRKIPIDELKIDKSFVDDINTDLSAQHMVRTIISIGKILDSIVILGEGVENEDQLNLLHSYGCDTYQGYLFSKPLSPDDLVAFINRHDV